MKESDHSMSDDTKANLIVVIPILMVLIGLFWMFDTHLYHAWTKSNSDTQQAYNSAKIVQTKADLSNLIGKNYSGPVIIHGKLTSKNNKQSTTTPEMSPNNRFISILRTKYEYEAITTLMYVGKTATPITTWDWEKSAEKTYTPKTINLLGQNFKTDSFDFDKVYTELPANKVIDSTNKYKVDQYYYTDDSTRYSYQIVPNKLPVTFIAYLTPNHELIPIRSHDDVQLTTMSLDQFTDKHQINKIKQQARKSLRHLIEGEILFLGFIGVLIFLAMNDDEI